MVRERKERVRKCPITPALANADITVTVKTPLSTSVPEVRRPEIPNP